MSHPSVTGSPWRVLVLDRSSDGPKWIIATVSVPSDVQAAEMEPGGNRYAGWPAGAGRVRAASTFGLSPCPQPSGSSTPSGAPVHNPPEHRPSGGRPVNHGGVGEKRCSRCRKVKPLTEFSRAAHGRDGRAVHCKDCHNALDRLPLDRVPTLTCLYCGKEFLNPARRGPDRKFCSSPCRAKWWRDEYARRRQAAPPRPCNRRGVRCRTRRGCPSAWPVAWMTARRHTGETSSSSRCVASRRPTTTGCSRSNMASAPSARPPRRAPAAPGELTTITKPARSAAACATAATSASALCGTTRTSSWPAARYVMEHRQKEDPHLEKPGAGRARSSPLAAGAPTVLLPGCNSPSRALPELDVWFTRATRRTRLGAKSNGSSIID